MQSLAGLAPSSADADVTLVTSKRDTNGRPTVVEQNRLLSGMIKCVQFEGRSSGAVCNEQTCPTMSAGS